MKIQKFEDIKIWKLSLEITQDIYDNENEFNEINNKLIDLANQRGSFLTYLIKLINDKQFLQR